MFKYLLVILALTHVVSANFDLIILHNNDIHGRFEETERNSGTCQPNHRNKSCVGGFARTAHLIRKFRKEADDGVGPPVLYLNAGDTFIGTVWYTIHTWNISSAFMNLLRPDVQCLGNHEFDKGTDEIEKFVSALNYPTIGGNVDFSKVPNLVSKIPKSVILNVNGTKVGVVGYVTTETVKISSPGDTIFLNEIQSVKEESERLNGLGINIIIVLGHGGYQKDQEIAKNVPLVDVVVGGHTNTFLWNGPQPDTEPIEGPYPKLVTQPSGKQVPVVQAYAYTKYLGKLNLTFSDKGDLLSVTGQPILLDHDIPQDKDVLELLEVYRPAVDEVNKESVGKSLVLLDNNICRSQECNFGNLVADSMVLYKAKVSPVTWTETPIGLMNGGGIRLSIAAQDVSRGEILGTLPFGSQIVALTLTGSALIKTLELGVRSNGETSMGEFLQVSGLQVVYDRSKPAMSRVVSVKTRCGSCSIPTYEHVDLAKNYSVITTDFLADGNDGHYVLKEDGWDRDQQDLGDVETLTWYFNTYSPVFAEVQSRISFVQNGGSEASSAVLLSPPRVHILFFTFLYFFIQEKMLSVL